MAAYLKGDMSAFAELFQRYTPVLQRLLWRSLRDEVPDFVQQTFLHVHRARHTFAEGALFRPWLVSIAINLKHEHFRRRSRRLAIHPDLFTFGARPPSEPDAIYEADQAWRSVESLPARERKVLELLCGGGLSAADVAAEMRTTTAGVKSLAHRARQRLRSHQVPERAQPPSSTRGSSGSSKYPASVR
ncbi:MAG: RNA polymerase sigma factor [Gammaproteobacteria bacterium]